MNFDLGSDTNKLILVVVVAVALLLALHTYQKQLGRNVAVGAAIVTFVVVGYVVFNLMNKHPVQNVVNDVENVNNLVEGFYTDDNDSYEHFQANEPEPEDEDGDESVDQAAADNAAAENQQNQSNKNAQVDDEENRNNPVDNGVFKCTDLLPGDTDSTWAQVSPSGVGELCSKNLLNAGHHVGVNTTGTSLRNANRQIRSEPPCPQVNVSPWLQTTIAPDLLRRPLE